MASSIRLFIRTHGAILFFILCVLWFLAAVVLKHARGALLFSDFASYYYPALALKSGLNFYDPGQVNQLAQGTLPFWKDIGPYLYPPFFLLLITPLTALKYATAKLIWMLFNVVILTLLGREFYVFSHDTFKKQLFWIFAGMTLLFFPISRVLAYGQMELIITLFLLATYRFSVQRKFYRAGFLLGIAAALKLYPLFFLLFFALRKQWRIVFSALLTFVMITAMSFLFVPYEQFTTYTHTVIPNLIQGEASEQTVNGKTSYAGTKFWPGNYSLTGIFSYTLTQQDVSKGFINAPQLATRLTQLASLSLLIITLVLLIRYLQPKTESVGFALVILTFLLINPLTWEHYLVLTLPCFFILFHWIAQQGDAAGKWILPTAVIWLLLAQEFYAWHPWARDGIGVLWLGLKGILLIMLYFLSSVLIYQAGLKSNSKTTQLQSHV